MIIDESKPLQTQVNEQQSVPTGWRLESQAAALERFLERHQIWILALWSVAYFAGTMLRAKDKPFWYDEILTVLEARQPTLPAALRALGDADWMPPANHLTFYFAHKLWGAGEMGFRIPVIIAYWVFCLGLFFFARRRVSFFFAFTAMLLPYASAFQSYSYEARSYAFVLAFCGIALVSWQAAAEGEWRPWSLVGLAIGIAGAIAFHYWAVLIYLPLGAAEAWRSIQRRRVDWPIWGAFVASGAPLVAFLPIIRHGLNSWLPYAAMQAGPWSYGEFYATEFRVYFAFAIPVALLLAAWFVLGGRKAPPAGARQAVIPEHEWVAAAILLLTPVVAVTIALVLPPHGFTPRYAAPAALGYALLGAFLAARLAGRRSAIGLACAVAALAPFVFLMTNPHRYQTAFQPPRDFNQQLQHDVVVVEEFVPYLQFWYYAPESLKPRVVFVVGRNPEVPTSALSEFLKLGIPVIQYADFVLPGREFLVYPSRKDRLEKQILRSGGTVETVASSRHRVLRVRIAR